MIYEIKMPSLGADMDKGRFIEWKVKVGDHVNKDQEIAVIETPKAAVEVDSFKSGRIVEIIAKPDEVYPVGFVLAKMELDFAEAPVTETAPVPTPKTPSRDKKIEETPASKPLEPGRQRISPAARKLAEQEHIEINNIKGSGPDGTVELKDIQDHIQASKAKPEAIMSIRESIARTMSRSKKEIPHYYLKTKVCVDALIEALDTFNASLSAEDLIMVPALLMHVLSLALKKHPEMNGYYENEKFVPHSNINMGMAIALKTGGVIAPAILGLENLDITAVNKALKDLIARTREGKLKTTEISTGTITVTNLGDSGCEEVFGVIFPPQVALIGLGRIRKEPIADNNNIRAGFVLNVTLSADHRVTDGLSGSRFLQTVSDLLSNPNLVFKDKR